MRRFWHRVMVRLGPGVAFFLIKFLQWTMRIEEVSYKVQVGVIQADHYFEKR
jgi:hypothetical protein